METYFDNICVRLASLENKHDELNKKLSYLEGANKRKSEEIMGFYQRISVLEDHRDEWNKRITNIEMWLKEKSEDENTIEDRLESIYKRMDDIKNRLCKLEQNKQSEQKEKDFFEFTIQYFKMDGKYYTKGKVNWEVDFFDIHKTPNMHEATEKMRKCLESNGPNCMPGLHTDSRGWDGHIIIDCDKGFPVMLPNLKRKDIPDKN